MCGLVLGLYSVFVYQYSKAKLVTSAVLPFQPWQVFLIRRGSLSACSRSFCRMILASLLHKYHATIFSLTWVVAGCNFGCCTCVHTLDLCIIHTLRRWLRTSSRLCESPQCLACTTFTPLNAWSVTEYMLIGSGSVSRSVLMQYDGAHVALVRAHKAVIFLVVSARTPENLDTVTSMSLSSVDYNYCGSLCVQLLS